MTVLKHYPGADVGRGEGFFVPALDLEQAREAGLLAAVKAQVKDARAAPCIYRGRLGIYFYRLGATKPTAQP